jgi:hypothetical protein
MGWDLTAEKPYAGVGLGIPANEVRSAAGRPVRRLVRCNRLGDAGRYRHGAVVEAHVLLVPDVLSGLAHGGASGNQRAEEFSAVLHDAPFRAMARRVSALRVSRASRCAAESVR